MNPWERTGVLAVLTAFGVMVLGEELPDHQERRAPPYVVPTRADHGAGHEHQPHREAPGLFVPRHPTRVNSMRADYAVTAGAATDDWDLSRPMPTLTIREGRFVVIEDQRSV